ncbi:MAG: hypothetical protein ACKOD9_18865 [Rubrivivax sp.]
MLSTKIAPEQLNQVLWRWKVAGLIRPVGPRADVWFNLVRDADITRERWEQAVKRALPSAVRAGHPILMSSGLSTQMSSSDYLIRPARSLSAGIDGATLHERPALWMRRLQRVGAIQTCGVLPQLDPGAALADLIRFEPGFDDQIDEIDWDELSEESRQMLLELVSDADVELPRQALGGRSRVTPDRA